MPATQTNRYTEAVGRRKTSVARVRITEAAKLSFTVNNRDVEQYFPTGTLMDTVMAPMTLLGKGTKYKITAKLSGGGISSQADALRMGIARVFNELDAMNRGTLKKAGFLKRDARAKERRKFGLKKARKAPQWSKR